MCRCAVRMGRRAHLFGRGTHPKDSPRHRHRRVDRCARLERHAGCTRNVHRHHAAHSPSPPRSGTVDSAARSSHRA